MWAANALSRYLWERGLDVYTDPEEPPGQVAIFVGFSSAAQSGPMSR